MEEAGPRHPWTIVSAGLTGPPQGCPLGRPVAGHDRASAGWAGCPRPSQAGLPGVWITRHRTELRMYSPTLDSVWEDGCEYPELLQIFQLTTLQPPPSSSR